MKDSYIYLASPYTHKDMNVQIGRYESALACAAWLSNKQVVVFSPIVNSHPMHVIGLPGDWEFWKHFDDVFIRNSSGVMVLTISGWKKSTGIAAELLLAEKYGLPVSYINEQKGSYEIHG